MKRQMVRGLTMLTLMVVVAFGTAAVVANGQSRQQVVTHVPFDFVIGDKTLPAGDYTTTLSADGGSRVLVQNDEANSSIFRLTNSIQADPSKSQARLVFHRYGQSYFLSEVWIGGDISGRALLRSKQESSLRREMGRLAQNTYQTIELVAMLR